MAHAISLHERDMIYQMAEIGWTDQTIAEKLGRHRLTVLKWRRRGMVGQGAKEGGRRWPDLLLGSDLLSPSDPHYFPGFHSPASL